MEQCERRFIRQLLQAQTGPTRMIEDGQRQMRVPLSIRLHQQIAAPNPISRHRSRHTMFQLSSGFKNQIVVLLQRSGNVAFSDRHLSSTCPAPVEVMRNGATARVRHQGLQPNNLIPNPFRLGLSEDPVWWCRTRTSPSRPWRVTEPSPQPGTQGLPDPHTPVPQLLDERLHRGPLCRTGYPRICASACRRRV